MIVACHTLAMASVAGDGCEGRCLAMPWVAGVVTEGGHQFPRESLLFLRLNLLSLRAPGLSMLGCWTSLRSGLWAEDECE